VNQWGSQDPFGWNASPAEPLEVVEFPDSAPAAAPVPTPIEEPKKKEPDELK